MNGTLPYPGLPPTGVGPLPPTGVKRFEKAMKTKFTKEWGSNKNKGGKITDKNTKYSDWDIHRIQER